MKSLRPKDSGPAPYDGHLSAFGKGVKGAYDMGSKY